MSIIFRSYFYSVTLNDCDSQPLKVNASFLCENIMEELSPDNGNCCYCGPQIQHCIQLKSGLNITSFNITKRQMTISSEGKTVFTFRPKRRFSLCSAGSVLRFPLLTAFFQRVDCVQVLSKFTVSVKHNGATLEKAMYQYRIIILTILIILYDHSDMN